MPFPCLKTCHVSGFGSLPRLTSVEKPDGTVETKVCPCNEKLPAAAKFDLAAQVQAGVTLQEVNTKILGSGVPTEELSGAMNQIARKAIQSKQTKQAQEAEEK